MSRNDGEMSGIKARWEWILFPPLLLTLILLVASQFIFVRGSFHKDLGFGDLSTTYELINYFKAFSDPYYLDVLLLSIYISAAATVLTMIFAVPVAYIIARMTSRWAILFISLVVVAQFVTIAIKVLGLIVLFSPDGIVNRMFLALGLIEETFTILGTYAGVVAGLMYYSLGFAVMLIYSVILTIPRSLEEAGQILGANRLSIYRRIILPLATPAIVICSLMVFNISIGGFASTALIGVGKILTLPVIVQQTVIVETNYGMGAALAVILLVAVILINLFSVSIVKRLRRGPAMTV
ncbi:MAG: ABC transporter permease [Proteobacteria bacterium]|nr:ABC transporter permease [Pseudomonadota bacterium]